MSVLTYSYVDGWCACIKVNGVTETSISHPRFPSLETIITESLEEEESPCLMITTNEEEVKVIEWLKANKFKKGPLLRNWGHGGRKTQAWFYQIPKKKWQKATGLGNGWDDYVDDEW